MAEENFEVMISEQEYKKLKEFTKKNQELQGRIQKLQSKVGEESLKNQELQNEITQKGLEVKYLVELILNIAATNQVQEESSLMSFKSGTFEVLGQSIMEPEKAQATKITALRAEFAKRHAPVLKKVTSIEDRLESQEALISKLNQLNSKKKEVAFPSTSQVAKLKKTETELKELQQKYDNLKKMDNELKELHKSHEILKKQNDSLKRQKAGDRAQFEQKIKAVQGSTNQSSQKLKREVYLLKTQNEAVKKRASEYAQRVKDMEMELSVLKQGLNRSFPKQETKDQIKALLNEYAREILKNLKSIEGLGEEEIKNLMKEEMNEFSQYVKKSISSAK